MGEDREAYKQQEIIDGRTLERRQKILLLAENVALTAAIAWVFYNSIFGAVIFPIVVYLNTKRMRADSGEKFSCKLENEYREMFVSVTGALQTGYSIEKAFAESAVSLSLLYGEKSVLLPHIKELNTKVRLRMPVEQAFEELSAKFDSEDLADFSQIFKVGKRLGGDYVTNIRDTTRRISERVEVRQEIRTAIAQQQLELKVMMAMPLGILAYMKLSAPEFLTPSYGNAAGIMIMTVCLAVYAGCIALGKKITDIRV